MTEMPSQQVLEEKTSEVEEIKDLLRGYKSIGIASLQKVRAAHLQELKKNLAGKVYMRVLKNKLTKFAIEDLRRDDLNKLEEYLEGSNLFLFTNLNPFKLALLLERGKVKTTAKSGDIAAMDVVIPAGNTGQPPGPIISQLNAVGLPTRIESGSVWVSKDTLVARKGESISTRLAAVLSKLGIKAVEAGLSMRAALDEGLMIDGEQLKIDIKEIRKNFEQSHGEAFALSVSVAYPTAENMTVLLQTAQKKAFTLSLNAAIATKETTVDLVKKAHMEMLSLNTSIEKAYPKN
ncbi:MAG: 50S ribosomal protein L10 [Candidatus Bathyarchaeota archaeon]|nr:MAG: 50S ribosomal protein L10 [Candidatus Bathyarchaeota archaeon]